MALSVSFSLNRGICSTSFLNSKNPYEKNHQGGFSGGRDGDPVSAGDEGEPQGNAADAPSTLAVVGRYILTPRIFHHLKRVQSGSGEEIQLTDGIAALLAEEKILVMPHFVFIEYPSVGSARRNRNLVM